MLRALILAFAAVAPALAAAPASASAPAVVTVPQDRGAQDVAVLERTIPPGGGTGWHTHPGIEIMHVVSGEADLHTARAVARYKAGDTAVVPREAPHNAVNAGSGSLILVVTYVIDHGAPLRTDIGKPEAE